MNAAFVIAEYNPLHKGHVWHLSRTREALAADAVVCIMSGHFTQRGFPTISDKWSRARMALHAGADLVLELHPVFACAGAEVFAQGALLTASSLGVEGYLSFGAECDDLELLGNIADILADEPLEFRYKLADELSRGQSFASARARSAASAMSSSILPKYAPDVLSIMKSSNNILALEYLKAMKTFGISLIPYAVRRIGGGYLDTDISGGEKGIPSATAIRRAIRTIDSGCVLEGLVALSIPRDAAKILSIEFDSGRGPVFEDDFFHPIITILRRLGKEELRTYKDIREGLENRVINAAGSAASLEELVSKVSARRYPKSSISRLFFRVLLGFNQSASEFSRAALAPRYIRVLGFNERGRKLLRHANPEVPIVTNVKSLMRSDVETRRLLELDFRATDIYVTAFKNPGHRISGQDCLRAPVVLGRV